MASARMWPTPSRTFSTDSIPFSALMNSECGGDQVDEGLVTRPDPKGQGFEPAVAGIGSLGAFLGLKREIKVFEPFGVVGRADGGRQVWGHLPLGLDRLQDGFFSLRQLAQSLHARLNLADHDLVEAAGPLLAVARDKGNRIPIVQKLDDALHLQAPNLQVLRDTPQVDLNRDVHGDSTLHQVRQERRRCSRQDGESPETLTATRRQNTLLAESQAERTKALCRDTSLVTLED